MDQPIDRTTSSRKRTYRASLGMLMAFIAGMAVMLGLLAPWVSVPDSALVRVHPGIPATSLVAGGCASCHAGPTPRVNPLRFLGIP